MINASIDVGKIDKSRLYKGAKGTYLDITLIESPNNQYGDDYMIVQRVSKEERLAGVKGAILGNAKSVVRNEDWQNKPASAPRKPLTPDQVGNTNDPKFANDSDPIPF